MRKLVPIDKNGHLFIGKGRGHASSSRLCCCLSHFGSDVGRFLSIIGSRFALRARAFVESSSAGNYGRTNGLGSTNKVRNGKGSHFQIKNGNTLSRKNKNISAKGQR